MYIISVHKIIRLKVHHLQRRVALKSKSPIAPQILYKVELRNFGKCMFVFTTEVR